VWTGFPAGNQTTVVQPLVYTFWGLSSVSTQGVHFRYAHCCPDWLQPSHTGLTSPHMRTAVLWAACGRSPFVKGWRGRSYNWLHWHFKALVTICTTRFNNVHFSLLS
jgi:hypothetical protein